MSSFEKVLLYGVYYPGTAVVLLVVLALAAGWRVHAPWLKAATLLGLALSGVRLAFLAGSPSLGHDHLIFREVGQDVRLGLDPYDPARYGGHPFLHPPSTFPFFALLSVGPERASVFAAAVVYSAMALGLVFLSWLVLRDEGDPGASGLGPFELGALGSALALSDATTATVDLGQISVVASALILLALWARARGRPWLAGAALGVATMKVGTVVPFLVLFCRKVDRAAWPALALTVGGLCLATGHPERLPGQCRRIVQCIGELSRPGAVNDVSYQGPENEWILSVEHALYRFGVRDRSALRLGQFAVLGVLGAGLAAVAWRRSTPPGLAASMTALYSVVFLYHRTYDAVLFALPMTYALGQARLASGRGRWTWVLAIVAMLGVLYLRRRTLETLTLAVPSLGLAGRLVEVLILPIGTTATLAAMLLSWVAARGPSGYNSRPDAHQQGAPS